MLILATLTAMLVFVRFLQLIEPIFTDEFRKGPLRFLKLWIAVTRHYDHFRNLTRDRRFFHLGFIESLSSRSRYFAQLIARALNAYIFLDGQLVDHDVHTVNILALAQRVVLYGRVKVLEQLICRIRTLRLFRARVTVARPPIPLEADRRLSRALLRRVRCPKSSICARADIQTVVQITHELAHGIR